VIDNSEGRKEDEEEEKSGCFLSEIDKKETKSERRSIVRAEKGRKRKGTRSGRQKETQNREKKNRYPEL